MNIKDVVFLVVFGFIIIGMTLWVVYDLLMAYSIWYFAR